MPTTPRSAVAAVSMGGHDDVILSGAKDLTNAALITLKGENVSSSCARSLPSLGMTMPSAASVGGSGGFSGRAILLDIGEVRAWVDACRSESRQPQRRREVLFYQPRN